MGRRGCYNRLPAMLELAVRGAASGRWGCYNHLGVKLQPQASFCWKRPNGDATTFIDGCYNRQRWELQATMARWKVVTMESILLGWRTTVVAEPQGRPVAEMQWCVLSATTGRSGTTTATLRDDGDLLRCAGTSNRRKRGSWGGRRALVARPCRRPASMDEDERLRWALSS